MLKITNTDATTTWLPLSAVAAINSAGANSTISTAAGTTINIVEPADIVALRYAQVASLVGAGLQDWNQQLGITRRT